MFRLLRSIKVEPKPVYVTETAPGNGQENACQNPLLPVRDVITSTLDKDALWAKNEALRLFSVFGHWDQVALVLSQYLALSGASWWHVAQGQRITEAKINALRAYNGLPPLPVRKLLAVCPSCGGDHGLDGIPDCHGAPVAEVVCLTPEQRVTKKRTTKSITKWRDLPKDELAKLFTERRAYGEYFVS